MRRFGIGVLLLLWALWGYAFAQIVRLGLHFEPSVLGALLPELPTLDMTPQEWAEYIVASAFIYGTPMALGVASWLMARHWRKTG